MSREQKKASLLVEIEKAVDKALSSFNLLNDIEEGDGENQDKLNELGLALENAEGAIGDLLTS